MNRKRGVGSLLVSDQPRSQVVLHFLELFHYGSPAKNQSAELDSFDIRLCQAQSRRPTASTWRPCPSSLDEEHGADDRGEVRTLRLAWRVQRVPEEDQTADAIVGSGCSDRHEAGVESQSDIEGRLRSAFPRLLSADVSHATLLVSKSAWVVPFVFALIGEYVVEIIEIIEAHTAPRPAAAPDEICGRNPSLLRAHASTSRELLGLLLSESISAIL